MKFSNIEIEHLLKAWIAISLAFAIILTPGRNVTNPVFTTMLLVSGFTVGLGFLLHELGHKFMAQKYHCFAEFRAFNAMLVLAIAMSFTGFIFAAPGAVMINGYVNKERNGKISVAGPAVNLILGVLFLILLLLGFVNIFTEYGLLINAWLAAFNMIPFMNLDGKKILNWSKPVYFSVLGGAVALLLASGFV
jgi:Zn-dependent protease